jgi:predicted regulator of Ras-like GTPase activity (Roadblock/LC7/MglB family)|tara:strand:- start:1888 stop:2235 length:348 start_codon:yes stop_codon:yes gene_type:complete
VKAAIVGEVATIEGVSWCAISSIEGFIHEVEGAPAISLEGIGSLIPSILNTASILLSNIELGEPRIVTLNGVDGILVVARINDYYSIVCKTENGANLGMVRKQIGIASENLLPLL